MLWRLALVLALADATVSAQRAPITVSAAASLTDVLAEVAALYERSGGERVALNFGASNVLARQIAAGARVDVFVSADEAQMNVVTQYVDPATRVAVLSNQLAVAVPDDRSRRFRSAHDLVAPDIRRVAIGDPNAVPAGVYAKAYLEKIGLWEAVAPKVVPAGSVRLALAAVENGAADAAIVYRTDVATARRAHVAFLVPAADGPRIVYPAAVVRDAPNRDGARRFLAFLRGPEAAEVFERAGFLRP